MRLTVHHENRFEFEGEVTESVMDVRLGPFEDAHQRVQRFQLRWEPPGHVRRYEDGFGNVGHLLTTMRTHSTLQLSTDIEVETLLHDPFQQPVEAPRPLGPVERADSLNPSALVPALDSLSEMAEPFGLLEPFDAARQMMAMIYEQFEYQPGVTDVTTSVAHVFQGRQGVCQDFAHLLIGLCRAIRLPARYVSGYILTGDHNDEPSRGSGASHAWAEVFTPTHGWRGFDPTNNLVANDRYVKIALGRDYHDVPPTRGTYQGAVVGKLEVAVSTRHAH
ncbi:MAG: transglutaminase family protein [Chloroflexi bacterium]|nr:transglutaminase family protein [Chloroflexota bacterium]MBV9132324.1 transglutaminase family protein [Chloroflexota bacterium]MBV9898024.1 transglutaminase family protein [Chloroflexota bacterium]